MVAERAVPVGLSGALKATMANAGATGDPALLLGSASLTRDLLNRLLSHPLWIMFGGRFFPKVPLVNPRSCLSWKKQMLLVVPAVQLGVARVWQTPRPQYRLHRSCV